MTTTQPFPWFRQPRTAQGDYNVTWWVAVRNGRGTVTLQPRTAKFATETEAHEAAQDLGHAREAWVCCKGEVLVKRKRTAA